MRRCFPTSPPWRACGGGAVPLPLGERFPWEKEGWETEAGAGGGAEGKRRPRIDAVYLHEKEDFLEGLSLLTGGEVRDQDAVVEGVHPDGHLRLHVRAEVETVRGGEEGRAMLDVAGGGAAEKIRAFFKAGRWHDIGKVVAYKEGAGCGSEMGGGRNCPPFNGRRKKGGESYLSFLITFSFSLWRREVRLRPEAEEHHRERWRQIGARWLPSILLQRLLLGEWRARPSPVSARRTKKKGFRANGSLFDGEEIF